MCLRQAKKRKITLTQKFWTDDGWKVEYKQHMLAVNKLLKVFEPQAIINALNQKDFAWVTSLRVKAFTQCIIQEASKLQALKDKLKNEVSKPQETPEPTHIVKPFSTNKSKLKDLD